MSFGETKLIERFTNLGYSVEEATEMTQNHYGQKS